MSEMVTELKKMTKKMEQKKGKNIWKEISAPLTLHDALNNLTKEELTVIRRQLKIKNASNLKKDELITLLQEQIPLATKSICSLLEQGSYSLLEEMAQNGGHLEASTLHTDQIEHFRTRGIMFLGMKEGKRLVVLPKEIMNEIVSVKNTIDFQHIIKQNTEWVKLTHGLLYYYGTLPLKTLEAFLQQYIEKSFHLEKYLLVIKEANSFYQQLDIGEDQFSNKRVYHPEKVKEEHEKRTDLEFYPFTKKQLLTAGEPGYIERNESYQQFVHFLLKTFHISKDEADRYIEECVYAIKIGDSPRNILKFLQSRFKIDRMDILQEVMRRIIGIKNHTREWFLKGFTSSELSARQHQTIQSTTKGNVVEFRSKKKIGRNVPCPCGSEKKYKKCCGK